MDISRWQVQLKKGAAELAVLSILEKAPCYGSKIFDHICQTENLEVSEGSIYPLLKRLELDGKISSQWVEEEGATHPRKYYQLTQGGITAVSNMKQEWFNFAKAMDKLLTTSNAKGK